MEATIEKRTKASRNNRGSTKGQSRDDWRTPPKLFRAIEEHLGVHFIADMAASRENALCPVYFTAEYDTLAQPAEDIAGRLRRFINDPDPARHALFCNPPYSKGLETWMRKARHVSAVTHLPWVMLLPASRTEQDFFYACAAEAYNLTFLKDRADYLRPDGQPGGRPNHPSFVITFPGDNRRIVGGAFSHLEWKESP